MSANIGAAGNGEFIYEMEMMESGTTTANVVNEYVPIIPTFANLADVTTWSDVNSLTKTETLNSANAWYLVFKNAQSAWGANTELGVHQVTTGTYRKAVINTAGTWQYNSNATYGSETLTNATINTLAGAIRQALTVAANQMDSATLIQSMDASLSTPTGKAGIVPILYSTVNTNNPQVDQTRVNYDAQTSAMTFVSNPTIVEQIPSNMFITAIAEYTTGTPVYYLSRDNGTTWATATMTLKGTYSGTKKIYAGTADVSGQTSSSSLRYKITTTAGQDVKIYGAYVYGGDVSGGGGGSGVVSAGAQGQLAFYGTAGSALTATSSLFLSQAGNFGIGTSSPSYKLDVAGFINTDQYSGYKQAGNTVLYASTTNFSTAVGASGAADWMSALTSLSYNTAVGYQSLNTAPTGSANYNTALGALALKLNTAGQHNNAFGMQSLTSNISGNFNVANGSSALRTNITGSNNTAVGYQALYYNGSATSTTAFGANAGLGTGAYSNQGGTYLGYQSGYSAGTNSDYNTFLGYQSGYGVTTGSNNIWIGTATSSTAIANLTTGSQNILIGNNISLPSATANGQLNIGNIIFGTGITGTGSTVSTGFIGIGTTSPSARLTLWGTDTSANTKVLTIANSASTTLLSLANNGALTLNGAINNLGTATSTFANGINLTSGCFAIGGICALTASALSLIHI